MERLMIKHEGKVNEGLEPAVSESSEAANSGGAPGSGLTQIQIAALRKREEGKMESLRTQHGVGFPRAEIEEMMAEAEGKETPPLPRLPKD